MTSGHPDRQALARVLVDQRQHPQCSPVMRHRAYEVVASHVILALGRSVVTTLTSSGFIDLENLVSRDVFQGLFNATRPPDFNSLDHVFLAQPKVQALVAG